MELKRHHPDNPITLETFEELEAVIVLINVRLGIMPNEMRRSAVSSNPEDGSRFHVERSTNPVDKVVLKIGEFTVRNGNGFKARIVKDQYGLGGEMLPVGSQIIKMNYERQPECTLSDREVSGLTTLVNIRNRDFPFVAEEITALYPSFGQWKE